MRRAKRDDKIVRIGDLFEKYKRTLKAPESSVINSFIDVVQDVLSIELEKKHIRYTVSSKMLTLHVKGPIKSEILLRKKELLDHLKGRLGETSAPKDII